MNEIVKASKAIKGMTSLVSAHQNAVERAREIYLAQIKRAEADYFERIQRAGQIITAGTDESEAAPAPETTPPATPSETAPGVPAG